MEFIQLILGAISLICFLNWNELRQNTIRHDEKIFAAIGFIFLGLLLVSLFYETKDIPNLFNWF